MDITTLQYWHKLEHFYPYVIGEQAGPNIKTFMIESCEDFDELLGAQLPPGKAVRYYAVYLGLFQIDKALEALEQGSGSLTLIALKYLLFPGQSTGYVTEKLLLISGTMISICLKQVLFYGSITIMKHLIIIFYLAFEIGLQTI